MPEVLYRKDLAPGIVLIEVEAPRVAKKAEPGQFIVARLSETGERIPLTIADFDREKGTLTLIIQQVGKTTRDFGKLRVGHVISDLLGPLGMPYPIRNTGTVVCVAGGLGAAPMLPKAKAMKAAGNRVITILGAQTSQLLILEKELSSVSDEVFIATNDGSKGEKGFVTGPLKSILDGGEAISEVIAIGPLPMMEAVCKTTADYGIPTHVSLNTVMVDGTGMCGGCRVTVDGELKFTCVDGPAFDGHKVDFRELSVRQRFYRDEEAISEEHHKCLIGLNGQGGDIDNES